jgi:DNA-directed RNA polymerase specialized sigma subunit
MNYKNYDINIPEFDSKIKYYFSLFFISIKSYEVLRDTYGEDLNLFKNEAEINSVNNYENINLIFENLKWNNNQINLSDKTILNLFNGDEIKNYFESYSLVAPDFSIDDPEKLEEFYLYMMLSKVKEKKCLEFGTIYDLFDTFSLEEILNAVANLDYSLKDTFINLFGIKGDKTFEINSDNKVQNEILIKLYSYMLLKREEADILSIIRNIISKDSYEYNFYDYIRYMCKDKSLSNEFIYKMLSKMDYNSIKQIKEVFGESLNEKKKPSKDKAFKNAVQNLTVIIKVNKAYEKRKQKSVIHKKKVGVDKEKKEENKKSKKEEPKAAKIKEPKKEIKKEAEKPKKKEIIVEIKQDSLNKKTLDKKIEKPKKKEKEEKPKEKQKQTKLDKFLSDNEISKQDFLKATSLLDLLSKSVIVLYYGLKAKPVSTSEIMVKLKMKEEELLELIEEAENKIVNLIKSGKIKELKDEELSSNRLSSYAKENNLKMADVIKDMVILSSYEKIALTLSLNEKITNKKIASALNIDEKNISGIIDAATDKVIAELSNTKAKEEAPKEIIKEEKEPLEKQEEPKKENKKEGKKQEEKKYVKTSLNEVLTKNKISRSDFINNLNNLNMSERRMIKDYFGLGMFSLTLEEMSKKYGIKVEDINKTIDGIVGNMIKKKEPKKDKKEDKKEKEQSKLDKFLTVNKITKEQFMNALNNLSEVDRGVVLMYFGINQKEKSLLEIAKTFKTTPAEVKNSLTNILKNINNTIKNKDKNKTDKLDDLYQNAKGKLSKMYKLLMANAAFMMFLQTNPIMQQILLSITNFNYDLDMTSRILGMKKEEVISNLNVLTNVCYGYISDMNKEKTTEFEDDNEKTVGRRY